MKKEAIQLWQEMADLTAAKCKETCGSMGQCCSPFYCEFAADEMTKAGHPFEKVPFGKTFAWQGKCTVPPHFRKMCSLQQCKISGLGYDPKDEEWTNKYFELRDKLEMLEMEEEAAADRKAK